jgi:hypothetical protein
MHLATKRVGLSFEHANYTMGYGRNEPGPPAIVSTIADTGNLPDVRIAPMNETARAVGRCGVGRGRANNGWSDRASYVTWRRRTKEHPQA